MPLNGNSCNRIGKIFPVFFRHDLPDNVVGYVIPDDFCLIGKVRMIEKCYDHDGEKDREHVEKGTCPPSENTCHFLLVRGFCCTGGTAAHPACTVIHHAENRHQEVEQVEITQRFYIIRIQKTFPRHSVHHDGCHLREPGEFGTDENHHDKQAGIEDQPLQTVRHHQPQNTAV